MVKLGVNIDHVATLREARRGDEPSPLLAALECIGAGCDSIVCHLREDRRHIKDHDVIALRQLPGAKLNLEMSVASEIVDFACRIGPDQATLVPERRMEITTEGGLDVRKNESRIRNTVSRLLSRGIDVSLFINPVKEQIDASRRVGAGIIELHTGQYANAGTAESRRRTLRALRSACAYAISKGLEVNAGHGLNYMNVGPVADIRGMNELNIGHSIISASVMVGIRKAVKDMLRLVR